MDTFRRASAVIHGRPDSLLNSTLGRPSGAFCCLVWLLYLFLVFFTREAASRFSRMLRERMRS